MDRIGLGFLERFAPDTSIHCELALMEAWVRGCTHAWFDVSGAHDVDGVAQ
jgi:hypothetical protein